jgi:hypothetical protein
MGGVFAERGFESLGRKLQGERVTATLSIEEIRVAELDFELIGPGGGEVAVELHGSGTISGHHLARDRTAHQRQGERIGGAGDFKPATCLLRFATGLGQHAEGELKPWIRVRAEKSRGAKEEYGRIADHANLWERDDP